MFTLLKTSLVVMKNVKDKTSDLRLSIVDLDRFMHGLRHRIIEKSYLSKCFHEIYTALQLEISGSLILTLDTVCILMCSYTRTTGDEYKIFVHKYNFVIYYDNQ